MVLEAGRKALEKWEARAFRRDILYAMTLAHLGLASEALKAKEQAGVPFHQDSGKCWQYSCWRICSQPVLQLMHGHAVVTSGSQSRWASLGSMHALTVKLRMLW